MLQECKKIIKYEKVFSFEIIYKNNIIKFI